MSFKDILVVLTTYPEPTPVSAVEEAVELAVALGGRISAIACEVKIKAPGSPMGSYLLDIPAMVAAEVKKSATNTQQLLAAFQDAAEKMGVFQERIVEHCLTSEVPDVFVEYARLRDLTIVPVPEGDYVDQWYAEIDHLRLRPPNHRPAAHPQARRTVRAQYRDRGVGLQSAGHAGDRGRDANSRESQTGLHCYRGK